MKFASLSFGSIAVTTLAALLAVPMSDVSAQCVITDTGIQVAINGSTTPTERRNNINQKSNGGCVGNSVNTSGVQVQTGGNQPVRQNRNVDTTVNGGNNSPTGVNLKPVKIQTEVGIDVFNPAAR
jgi:hypothetical protein